MLLEYSIQVVKCTYKWTVKWICKVSIIPCVVQTYVEKWDLTQWAAGPDAIDCSIGSVLACKQDRVVFTPLCLASFTSRYVCKVIHIIPCISSILRSKLLGRLRRKNCLEPRRWRLQWAEATPLHSILGDKVSLCLRKTKTTKLCPVQSTGSCRLLRSTHLFTDLFTFFIF